MVPKSQTRLALPSNLSAFVPSAMISSATRINDTARYRSSVKENGSISFKALPAMGN